LTDEDVTKQKIDHLMTDEIPRVVGQYDRFLFYWSGHGDQMITTDNHALGFLPLADSKRDVFSTMVNMEDIARWNSYLSAQQALFVLDACLSGLAGSEEKGVQDTRLEQLSQSSRQLVTAGTDQENVIAGDKWTGSLFTDSFILGAKGAAQHSFGIVSLYSLIDYIQERVAIEKEAANWSKSLTPQVRKLRAGNGAFFFTLNADGTNVTGPLAATPNQTPESKGVGQPAPVDHSAEIGPVARAEQPTDIPAGRTQLASSALLKRLGDANVLFSVERGSMLDWLDLPDERYRRIAEASLALLKDGRLKHRANLDVIAYKYVTALGLTSESDLPPQPKIDKAALQKALLQAYNEENGTSARSLDEIVAGIATPAQANCLINGQIRSDISDDDCLEAQRTGCVRHLLTPQQYTSCLQDNARAISSGQVCVIDGMRRAEFNAQDCEEAKATGCVRRLLTPDQYTACLDAVAKARASGAP
jgi:hypothetical protein